jgi:hypothetical protein
LTTVPRSCLNLGQLLLWENGEAGCLAKMHPGHGTAPALWLLYVIVLFLPTYTPLSVGLIQGCRLPGDTVKEGGQSSLVYLQTRSWPV